MQSAPTQGGSPKGPEFPLSLHRQIESGEMDGWEPLKVLEWGMQMFAPRIALSASFGSPEGMVILHMMCEIDPSRARVFTIDTGRLPQETYLLIDRVRDRYGVPV